ncbi:FixH family protein [Azoarcus sp. L1K30]|uniref:FixH family protein n=1 Tax=Azoarcus sp. L1K30 TaxID=2820277 RepID=UPI001B844B93|nr:FixH family protein [Azoarcus sp. L1K30]MBR0564663.1 FixH family protein [Azoarcus sp. L1K30]
MVSDKKFPVTPWYKQGWPWFLIALPATAVVAGTITLVIAIKSWDGLVVDDYYKEGKAIVRTIERTELAKQLGLTAQLKVRSNSVRVEVSASDLDNVPGAIHLTISHPTQSGFDQMLTLRGQGGVFEGAIAPLSTGRWLFQLENESRNWRMNGTAYLPTETEIRIDPSGS